MYSDLAEVERSSKSLSTHWNNEFHSHLNFILIELHWVPKLLFYKGTLVGEKMWDFACDCGVLNHNYLGVNETYSVIT